MVSENEIKAAAAEYQRAWRAKNREKVREINKRYWRKYAERKAAQQLAAQQEAANGK